MSTASHTPQTTNILPIFAVAQTNSQGDINQNLMAIELAMIQAKAQQADLLVLPENVCCFAQGQQLQTAQQFEYIKNQLAILANRHHIWLVAGSIPCPYRPDGTPVPAQKVRSSCLLFDPSGAVVARYDKIHLFDAHVADTTGRYQESATFEAGTEIVTALTPFGCIGLMICFDVRFPQLALALRQRGADILTVPAAFTFTTGQMHWELLLRARAIDTQCMVLGAAQTGSHGLRQTWGHSMIIHSQGNIVAALNDDMGIITSPFDYSAQQTWRNALPLQTTL